MKNTVLIIIIALVLAVTGCSERVEIELDSTYTRLVVEGHITNDTMAHWVRITKSIDYYSNIPAPRISNAIVTLNDGYETIILQESPNPDSAGYYLTPSDYFGVPGRTYDLEIELPDEVGEHKSYAASSDLHPVAPIDSIKVVYYDDWDGYWEVQIFALDPAETEDFYSFYVYQNGEDLTYPLNEIGITDDRYFNGNYTNGIGVYYMVKDEENGDIIYPGDTIILKMGGVTKSYYNFILDLMDETFDFSNPLFSGPPANISSNISNGGLGFFAAYSVSYATTVYQGE